MSQSITFLPKMELRARDESQPEESRRQPWMAILNKLKEKQEPDSQRDEIESIPDDDVPEMFTYEEGIYYNHSG